MRFTIDRKKWLRGEGGINSALLRPSDLKQCCMGQVAIQCGVDIEHLKDEGYLDTLAEAKPDCAESLLPFIVARVEDDEGWTDRWESLLWVHDCYRVNDDEEISDAERETRLSELFTAHGHELVFVN